MKILVFSIVDFRGNIVHSRGIELVIIISLQYSHHLIAPTMFSAKSIRIISLLGLILLLVLQYFWFRNSYTLLELDILEKCEKSLDEVSEKHMFERVKNSPLKLKVHDGDSSDDQDEQTSIRKTTNGINQSNDININIQKILIFLKKPTSLPRLDTLYAESLKKKLGFVPSYSMQLVSDSIKVAHENNKYTLYNKIVDDQYVEVVLTAPLRSILREAQYIVIVSLLLVVMIGVILVLQLKSMLRENHFVSFIKDYTHALTHELKTPISGIFMSSSMLASGKLEDKPESRQLHYTICKDQSSKLLKTVERILLVAKAEHAAIVPSIESIEMSSFIEKTADAFRKNNYRQKNLTITTQIDPISLVGLLDPVLMENVLSNLIDNAIKYSNEQINIHIECHQEKGKLRLSIKDNGFGMSEKELKHIFMKFERGDKVEGKGIDGFGIGLNYVHKVIKAHKGSINVLSQEGQGSEFIIEIPNK